MRFNLHGTFKYLIYQLKRLRYIKDSPHQIALGFAFGVWTNFTPVFGLHYFIAIILSFIFKANMIATVIGVAITGLPFIFPFFMMISWYVGSMFFNSSESETLIFEFDSIINNVTEKFVEIFIGSIILFPIITFIIYFPILYILKSWKLRKSLIRKKT